MRYYTKGIKQEKRRKAIVRKALRVLPIVFVSIILLTFLRQAYYYENHYDKVAKVKSVDDVVVTIEDTNGYEWEFIGVGFKQGMIVKARMFTNYTDNIIGDDIVKSVNTVDGQYVKGY